jgi:hypothetical protein
MNSIKATWVNGQVVLDRNVNWPEGRRLLVLEEPIPQIDFMTEGEQSDDPEAVEAWIDELRAIPAVPHTPAEEAERLGWQEKMKAHNLDAVRQQIESEAP